MAHNHYHIDLDVIEMQPVLRRRKRTSERFAAAPQPGGTILPTATLSNTTQGGTQNTTGTSSGTSKTAATGTTTGTGTQQQANTYLPFQSQIQAGLGTDASNFLATGVAPNTQNVLNVENQAYNQAFQQGPAQQLAAQYGAGSPAIASAEEQGILQNTANVFSTQAQAYNSELGTAGNLALTPSGSTGSQSQKDTSTANTNQSWQNAMNEAQNLASTAFNTGLTTPI